MSHVNSLRQASEQPHEAGTITGHTAQVRMPGQRETKNLPAVLQLVRGGAGMRAQALSCQGLWSRTHSSTPPDLPSFRKEAGQSIMVQMKASHIHRHAEADQKGCFLNSTNIYRASTRSQTLTMVSKFRCIFPQSF